MSLTISSEARDSVTLISVQGELDLATAPELSELTTRLLEQGDSRLVYDLSGLTFCDSTGLTVFVRAKNRIDELGGRLSLAAPSAIVHRVLDVSGLLQVLDTRPSVADAVAAAAEE
jgi:anti-sigma B factor antagonist